MSKLLGDQGEAFVAGMLRRRGYGVREFGTNHPVVDLEIEADPPVRISVKTSASKRHVRLGKEASVAQLRDNDLLIALMPREGRGSLDLARGDSDLLIIPGAVARTDALHVHRTYLDSPKRSGDAKKDTVGTMVKGYSKRPQQVEAWARWLTYRDAWDHLPKQT